MNKEENARCPLDSEKVPHWACECADMYSPSTPSTYATYERECVLPEG